MEWDCYGDSMLAFADSHQFDDDEIFARENILLSARSYFFAFFFA